jgi:hypothetical protein
MNVTTVHGIICMVNSSNDYSCRDYPLPLPHRHCDAWIYNHEGERQHTVFLARESRPADYCDCTHPRFSCYGVVLRMVGTLYHAFAGGQIQ